MKFWSFNNPIRIESCSLNRLPSLMQSLGALNESTWLLVTTSGMTRRGLTHKVKNLIDSEISIRCLIHDSVTPNPELDDLDNVTQKYAASNVSGIIAIGGGSVLDAGKVLSVTLPHPEINLLRSSLREGADHKWERKIPLIAVPTTSGTGAEVTPFATVWDKSEHKKYSVTGKLVLPDIALLDAALTATLPYDETLNTGLDAISHACESLWNVNKTPVTEAFARQALVMALRAFPMVLKKPHDLKAREEMQQASMLAGLAISQTRTAIAHSISYPLTSHFDVPHGLACSFTLSNIISIFVEQTKDAVLVTLLLKIKDLLDSLGLYERLYEYLTPEQVQSLKDEMYHPERASNLSIQLSSLHNITVRKC